MNENIINLVKKLDWNLPKNKQDSAFKELLKVIEPSDCHLLVQPMLKPTWYNSVLLIDAIGYPRNKSAMNSLIWLLQDLNWPGASMAISILKRINKKELAPLLETAVLEAYKCHDYIWLAGIKILITDIKLIKQDFNDPEVHDLLELSEF